MTHAPKSLAEQNYQAFAERYAAVVDTKPHNAYCERPATLSLTPDVQGLRVLDAGCGPGFYTEWLLTRGASVVACDATPKMVEITRRRINNALPEVEAQQFESHQADLSQPLGFADDERFNLVLCPLVLDYIEDWGPVFKEFFRVLQPGGWLIFSCGHPSADFLFTQERQLTPGNYFAVEQFEMEWRGFGEPYPVISSYRRPLQVMLNPLIQAGFMLDEILEPRPTAEYQAADPAHYDKFMREPCFLCVRVRKPASSQ